MSNDVNRSKGTIVHGGVVAVDPRFVFPQVSCGVVVSTSIITSTYRSEGFWDYEFCVGQSIRQYHLGKRPRNEWKEGVSSSGEIHVGDGLTDGGSKTHYILGQRDKDKFMSNVHFPPVYKSAEGGLYFQQVNHHASLVRLKLIGLVRAALYGWNTL